MEETVIESTETDQDEIIEVEEIEVKEDDDIEVPFANIEDIPIFPGCEKVSKKKQSDCFREKSINKSEKIFHIPKLLKKWVYKVGYM